MVDYLPRSAWGARAAESGPGSLTVSRVVGAVIHWPGTSSPTPITSRAAVASALRGWQAYHMDGRGWSDIAYQVAVDQAGRAWTLRGLRTQSGANGNETLNETYGAILLVLIAGEQPSAAMNATVRGVIADFRKIYPKGTLIVPHSKVRPAGTDCPGDQARASITRGDFTPRPTTPPPPTPSGGLTMADAASLELMLEQEASRTLGRYQRAEAVAAAQANLTKSVAAAVAALAAQIKAEDAADDAALQALIKSVNDNVDALETVIETPPVVEVPKA